MTYSITTRDWSSLFHSFTNIQVFLLLAFMGIAVSARLFLSQLATDILPDEHHVPDTIELQQPPRPSRWRRLTRALYAENDEEPHYRDVEKTPTVAHVARSSPRRYRDGTAGHGLGLPMPTGNGTNQLGNSWGYMS